MVHKIAPESDDYFAMIQTPQDLSTILKRTQNGEYQFIGKWLSDLKIV
jgi:hypothetical protein